MDWEQLRSMDLSGRDVVYEDHHAGRVYRGPISRVRWSAHHLVIVPGWVAEQRDVTWMHCSMVQPVVPFESQNVTLQLQDDGVIVIRIGTRATLRILSMGDNLEPPVPSPSPADALEFAT